MGISYADARGDLGVNVRMGLRGSQRACVAGVERGKGESTRARSQVGPHRSL